jgi:hypothetical protein
MRRILLVATSLAALALVPVPGWAQQPAPDASAAPRVREQIDQVVPVREASSVYLEPDEAAETHGRLAAGRQVRVVATLVGGEWVQVRLPDGTIGYMKATMVALAPAEATSKDPATAAESEPPAPAPAPVPAVAPAPAPEPAQRQPATADIATPAEIDGRPFVRDTATLVIDGRAVLLAGIEGVVGDAVEKIQDHLAAHGDRVSCKPYPGMLGYYACTLSYGRDLAGLLLANGMARIAAGAPDGYAAEQDKAVQAHLGIWAVEQTCAAWTVADAVATVALTDAADEGLYFADREPFVMLDGEPAAMVFDATRGWGYFDAGQQWTPAPERWRRHLDNVYPRGKGLRDATQRANDLHDGQVRAAALHESEARQHTIGQQHTFAERQGRLPWVPVPARPPVVSAGHSSPEPVSATSPAPVSPPPPHPNPPVPHPQPEPPHQGSPFPYRPVVPPSHPGPKPPVTAPRPSQSPSMPVIHTSEPARPGCKKNPC